MSKYKSPHAKLNFKKAALYGEQQGFGPFRQRFAPVPKNKKTAPSVTNIQSGKETQQDT